MRKYLIALAPISLCSAATVLLHISGTWEYPEPGAPYRPLGSLDFLESRLFWAGAVLSGMLLIVVFFEDLARRIDRYLARRRIRKGMS